jgi:hypothetical protein
MPYAEGIFLGILPPYPQAENRLIRVLAGAIGRCSKHEQFCLHFHHLVCAFLQ